MTQKSNRNNNPIGFTAYPSTDRTYNPGQTVLFDVAITNYGSGYNPDSSVFQCPVAGYYLFYVSLFTAGSDEAYVEIVIDGLQTFVQTYSVPDDANSASNVVFSYCELNQSVRVRCIGVTSCGVLLGSLLNTFSGVLLY